ncbi:hypothetical protein BRADI_3g44500v3 [Brachypodium distachyon]|uniref:Uncharacterized protein n=1 Tax=Brachypodium distachyon TaxID=15368 RepID=I1IA31_BRADI|nr:hypothetical protein BRADI_3g44500v3 [Brachypodium distachyon]
MASSLPWRPLRIPFPWLRIPFPWLSSLSLMWFLSLLLNPRTTTCTLQQSRLEKGMCFLKFTAKVPVCNKNPYFQLRIAIRVIVKHPDKWYSTQNTMVAEQFCMKQVNEIFSVMGMHETMCQLCSQSIVAQKCRSIPNLDV